MTGIGEALKDLEEFLDIGEVESGGGLVEDEQLRGRFVCFGEYFTEFKTL